MCPDGWPHATGEDVSLPPPGSWGVLSLEAHLKPTARCRRTCLHSRTSRHCTLTHCYPPWRSTAVRRPRPQTPGSPFSRDPASAIGCSLLPAPTRASAHPAPASVSRLARGGTWAGLSSGHAGRSPGADVTVPPPEPEPVAVSAASGPAASRVPRRGGSDPRSTPGALPPPRHGCAPRAPRSDGRRARVREGQADAPREGNPGRWAPRSPDSEPLVRPRFRVGRGRPGPAQLPEGRRCRGRDPGPQPTRQLSPGVSRAFQVETTGWGRGRRPAAGREAGKVRAGEGPRGGGGGGWVHPARVSLAPSVRSLQAAWREA